MRTEPRRRRWAVPATAGCLAALWLTTAGPSDAQGAAAEDARVEIVDPGILRPGATEAVTVEVTLSDPEARPLLLTPGVEGTALEIVRGRLLRADGQPTSDGKLRFALPVRVAAAGTSVLHVALFTYYCDAGCRPVRATATRIVRSGT